MHKISIDTGYKKKLINFPSEYSEIPLSLRVFICTKQLNKEDTKYFLLKHYFGDYLDVIPADNLPDFYELTAFIDETPLDSLLPTFRLRNKRYHAGSSRFEFTSALEFVMITEELDKIIQDKDESRIHNLAAIIYRPLTNTFTPSGDTREPIVNRSMINSAAAKFRKLPVKYLQAALIYAAANRGFVHKLYKSKLFTSGEPTDGKITAGLGWHHTFMDIAESGTFGNLTEVYQTNIHTLLTYLVKKKAEAQEMKSSLSNRP